MTQKQSKQKGGMLVEFAITAPVMIILGLGIVQVGLLFHAKITLNYATFEAARKGAVSYAQRSAMKKELAVRLAPLFGGNGKAGSAAIAMLRASADLVDPGFTKLEIINPTAQAFEDWGVLNSQTGVLEIPNSHLRQRQAERVAKAASGVSLHDANLLKIKVTYGYKMGVPLVGRLIAQTLLSVDSINAQYYRVDRLPLNSVATVRMHSPAQADNNPPATLHATKPDSSPAVDTSVYQPADAVLCDEHGLRSDIDSDSLNLLFQAGSAEESCSNGTTIQNLLNTSLTGSVGSSPLGVLAQQGTVTDCVPSY